MSANLLQQILKFESHLFVVCKCFYLFTTQSRYLKTQYNKKP